jgi:hypothetical protein
VSAVNIAAAWEKEPSEAIAEQIEWLLAQLNQSCSCAPELQFVRLRTLDNGSKHHVMQCTGCGEQRGNALSGKDAKARLGGRVAQPFDDEVHTVYVGKRRVLSDEHTALHELWMSRETPNVLPSLRVVREADEARTERVKANVGQCVEGLLQDAACL